MIIMRSNDCWTGSHILLGALLHHFDLQFALQLPRLAFARNWHDIPLLKALETLWNGMLEKYSLCFVVWAKAHPAGDFPRRPLGPTAWASMATHWAPEWVSAPARICHGPAAFAWSPNPASFSVFSIPISHCGLPTRRSQFAWLTSDWNVRSKVE